MFSWILALLLAVTCFVLATGYLWLVKRRRKEMQLGLQALAGMHWRNFSELVKRALHERRGLTEMSRHEDDTREPRSDFLMADASGHFLVTCKHGLAYRIGTAAINELGAAARLAGARGGILITEGLVDGDGQAIAEKQAVEVLDGRRLWPLLSPYLPGDIESGVKNAARHEAIRRIVIAAFASSTLGLLVGMGYQTVHVATPDPAPAPAVTRAAPAAPAVAATVPAVAAADPAPRATQATVAGPDLNPDTETLDRYQQEISRALSKLPGVHSGIWQTRQTLAVNRTGELDQVWPMICDQVTRYPALSNVRIQLNARPGVDEPVRWRQCSTL
ncbi:MULTISPECIES: restriction endonuclease [Stenotrophomonas]|uniref:restriction endonuclease n=1 Tax=Stenotrophomonas TaxID=40323 RepID=UPI0015F9DC63|nr:restriction endonuclease [Stenotrophomonas lacuserhaii]